MDEAAKAKQPNRMTNRMRELLTKWAELEPALCEEFPRVFTIRTATGYTHRVSDYLSDFDLAWIQWSVQEAVTERGWLFVLTYNHGYENSFYAKVCIDKENCINLSGSSLVEVFLTAYLRVLEKTK